MLPDERPMLSMGGYGEGLDFFTFKGAIETILDSLGIDNARFSAEKEDPTFHPGRCAKLSIGGKEIGVFGQIHPLVAKNYGMDADVFAAHLNFTELLAARKAEVLYQPLPKFPAVERDIAVVCDSDIPVADLADCIARGGKGLVKDVKLFDIYTGKPIPEGKKSVAFALKLRAEDHTLTDEESEKDIKSVLALLEKEYNAVLR